LTLGEEEAEVADCASWVFRNLERAAGDTYNPTKLSEVELALTRLVQARLPGVSPRNNQSFLKMEPK
jgi:hypothetical protein